MYFFFYGDILKKTIAFISFIFSFFLIYKLFDNNKINFVSISDYSINSDYNYNDYLLEYLTNRKRLGTFNNSFVNIDILSIYKDVLNNRTIRVNNNDYYFKKVLRESDFIVISAGMNEIINNYDKYDMNKNKKLFSSIYSNVKLLIKEIRKYSKGKIVFLGYYNPTNYYDSLVDEVFYDLDNKLNKLMLDNKISYISLYELIKGNKYKNNKAIINKEGFIKISNSIIFYL